MHRFIGFVGGSNFIYAYPSSLLSSYTLHFPPGFSVFIPFESFVTTSLFPIYLSSLLSNRALHLAPILISLDSLNSSYHILSRFFLPAK